MQPDPRAFIEAMRPAMNQAAAITRALEGTVANRPKQGEASPVKAALTIADTASQEALLVRLLECFPDVALEAEEDTPTVHAFRAEGDLRVVIDPLDGTFHSYLGGHGPYGIILALVASDRVEASLVALPREGLFFEAVRGGGVLVHRGDGEPVTGGLASGRSVFVSHELPEHVRAALVAHRFEPLPGSGAAIGVAPLVAGVCGAIRLANTVGGVSVRGRAALLVARESGALVTDASGAPFTESLSADGPVALVANSTATLDLLRDTLAS